MTDDALRETLLASDTAFQGRLLTMRVDTVRLPDGVVSTRDVVVHPGAVAMVPIDADGCVLLVRQWRHAAGQALLEIPAGTLAPGEDPAACAARELMEEIGYRPRVLTPLHAIYLAPGYSTERLHLFVAEDLTPERLAHDVDERIEVVRLPWTEVDARLARGEFADAKSVAGLCLARQFVQQR
jgi:ADP-ribose pyrophosphatase